MLDAGCNGICHSINPWAHFVEIISSTMCHHSLHYRLANLFEKLLNLKAGVVTPEMIETLEKSTIGKTKLPAYDQDDLEGLRKIFVRFGDGAGGSSSGGD